MIQLQKGESNVKKMILLVSAFMFILFLAACNGSSESFDPKVEQEKATEVMNSVLTSFEDQEKLAEAKTRDEANPIAWEKIKEKNNCSNLKRLNRRRSKKITLSFNNE